jgi:hypothetical protein
VWCAWRELICDAFAAVPSGNSAPVPAIKTIAGNEIRAFRPIRAATFPIPII